MHKHPDLIEIENAIEIKDWELEEIKNNIKKDQQKQKIKDAQILKKRDDEAMICIYFTLALALALGWSVSGAF